MNHMGEDTGMWDEEDGFFYDVLRLPDGQAQRLKVRSMVGLLPLCAATVFEGRLLAKFPSSASDCEVSRSAPRTARLHPRPAASPASTGAGSLRSSTRPSCAAS